jgi:hypothetical protein
MHRLLLLGAVGIVLSAMNGLAASPDEQAFLDKHIADVVVVTPKRLDNPAIAKAFAAPIYELNVTINSGDGGTMSTKQIAGRVDEKLAALSRPGTDGDCPMIQKMVNPSFVLKTDDDAKTLQAALDLIFPAVTDDDKKAVAFHHTGSDWSFVRGTFFNKFLGFVFTTDAQGKVTAVKFSLKMS